MYNAPNNIQIHNLICHRDVDIAVKCLNSLLYYCNDPIELVLHDDGSLLNEDYETINMNLGDVNIIKRKQADQIMDEMLKNHPICRSFRNRNVLFIKLFDVPLMSVNDFGYCDSDVIFIKPFRNMFSFPDDGASSIFMHDVQEAYSLYPWNMTEKNSIRFKSRINTGLFIYRSVSYDLDYLEFVLQNIKFRDISCWMEQTCWAALAYKAGCHHWDKSQVVMVSNKEDITKDTVAAHFGGSLRALLPNHKTQNIKTKDNSSKIDINSEIAKDCTAFRLTLDRIKVRIRRSIN